MKAIHLLLSLCVANTGLIAQYNNKNLTVASDSVASRFTYQNMRVYPVFANQVFVKAHEKVGKYVSLKEALQTKKVSITEKSVNRSGGGEVNKLYAQNLSDDSVIIIGGEVVQGGKQDRMIANDVILPPHSAKIDLSVFCVEHGRWATKGGDAGSYNFRSNYSTPVVSTKIRKAGGVTKNQSKVWEEVQEVTDKNESQSATGAYAALNDNTAYKKKLSGYAAFFKPLLINNPKIIGMVIVTGDRILGCELFATHDLFKQHVDDLIGSYATEVISDGGPVTLQNVKVKTYMDKLLADESIQEKHVVENGMLLKSKDVKLHLTTY